MSTPITVTGNLTDDPELRFTPNGTATVRFSVAVNARVRQSDGTWTDGDPSYYNVTAWRDLAERVAESLTKGTRVVVTGRLEQRHWTTEGGEKRATWQITADDIGASLMFATVTVVRKASRRNGADVPPDDPWATARRTRPVSGPPAEADPEPPF